MMDRIKRASRIVLGSSSKKAATPAVVSPAPVDNTPRWRNGGTPTRAEMYAETFKMGETDYQRGSKMFSLLNQMQKEPGNPGYAPYTAATSKAVSYFGTDIDEQWLGGNAGMMGKGRISETGSSFAPQAPTKNSTQAQNDAYWYSVVVDDYNRTKQAEAELAQLQTKVQYWAGREDRGMSADDIVARVDWNDYPTLKKAREGASVGEPLAFTSPISCSDDDLYGMVWSAWNPDQSSGDTFTDSISYALGRGSIRQKDAALSSRLNPADASYNPYLVGSTMDEAAEYFGVSSFEAGWANSESGMRAKGGSDTDRKMRAKVMDAEEFTAAAEAEAAELNGWLTRQTEAGGNIDAILQDGFLDRNYPHLADMAEGLDKGIPVPTTRAIDFDWRKMQETAQRPDTGADDFVAALMELGGSAQVGTTRVGSESEALIQAAALDADRVVTKQAAGLLADIGTPTEVSAIASTGADYDAAAMAASDFLQNGVPDSAAYSTAVSGLNRSDGVELYRLLDEQAEMQGRLAEIDQNLQAMEAFHAENGYYEDQMAYDSMIAAKQTATKELAQANEALLPLQEQFLAVEDLRPNEATSSNLLSYREDYQQYSDGIPGFAGWDKANHYDEAVAAGTPAESVREQMHADLDSLNSYRQYVESMITAFEDAGMGDTDQVRNMRAHVDLLTEGIAQIETNMLDEREDFAATVAEADAALPSLLQHDSLNPQQRSILTAVLNPAQYLTEHTQAQMRAQAFSLAPATAPALPTAYVVSEGMSDAERARFKYIWMEDGADAAIAYFIGLEATVNQRNTQQMEKDAYDWANESTGGAIAAGLLNPLLAPAKVVGFAKTGINALFGQKTDPNAPEFAASHVSQGLLGGSKERFVAPLRSEDGSETPGSQIVGFVYDVVQSGADNSILAFATGPLAPFLMAGSSAGDTAMSSLQRNGGDSDSAALNGLASAAAEYATEKIPMGQLDEIMRGNKKGFGSVWAMSLTEAPGEALSTLLSGVSDRVFMDGYSDYEQRIAQLESEGMSSDEAQLTAEKEFWRDVLYSGVVGWASSGVSGSVAQAAGDWRTRQAYKHQVGGYSALLTRAGETGKAGNIQAAEALVVVDATNGAVDLTSARAAAAAASKIGVSASQFQAVLTVGRDAETAAKAMRAMVTGALDESSGAAAALRGMAERGVTKAGVDQLIAAHDADMTGVNAEAVRVNVQRAVTDFRTGVETANALKAADHTQIEQLNEQADTAKDAKAEANRKYKAAKRDLKAAQAAFVRANQAVTETPIPTKEALAVAKAAQQQVAQARQAVVNAREAQKAATRQADTVVSELEDARQAMVTEARLQAQTIVQEQLVAEQAARVEAEEQAQIQAEEANTQQLSIDNFLAENGYDRLPASMQDQAAHVYQQVTEARANIPVEEAVPQNLTPDDIALRKAEAGRKRAIQFAGNLGRRFNVDVKFVDPGSPWEGKYEDGVVYLSKNATQGDAMRRIVFHEFTHRAEESGLYKELSDAVLQLKYGDDADQLRADLTEKQTRYQSQLAAMGYSQEFTEDDARAEIVADAVGELLFSDEASVQKLVDAKPTLARRVMDWIQDILDRVAKLTGREVDQLRRTRDLFARALDDVTRAEAKELKRNNVSLSESGTASKYSLASWTDAEKKKVRDSLRKAGFEDAMIDAWMDDVNSVASIIAEHADQLDYEADPAHVALKNNQEYKRTLDFSTLCAKRLMYQGTFNALQKALPNTVLTSDMLIELNNMMDEAGHETPCACCYVESRRRHLGEFAQKWLDSYAGEYKPSLAEITTTDGLTKLKAEHPDVAQAFIDEMNRKGSNNPKVVQLRTDYRGDIRNLTKPTIENIKRIGGLRIQSFSDFETPHLIDMMQAVLDMTSKSLTSQAYTKVPNFAWVFGDTGIKINLSLLAEGDGLNPDGTLRFSSKEGMDFDEAMRLRDRYSENVGTILVGVSDEHIRAAFADPRIDYIIPFHRSGWGEHEMELMTKLRDYTDYQNTQNERRIVGYTKDGKPKYESCAKEKSGNFYPIDYWDYSKSGDENAKTYLRLCEEDGRVPKFDQFLTKDADGHWVAPSGYWKTLIDFKMYDNDGKGAPQKTVQPKFNMDEAKRVLGEYDGDPNNLPVAWDIVDKAAEKFGKKAPKFSLANDQEGLYVKVNTDQHLFDGKSVAEMTNIARDYILSHFRNQYVGEGSARAHVTRDTADKYTHSANRRISDESKAVKYRAATELPNLISASTFEGHYEDDGRHKEAVRGWDHYTARVELGGEMFSARALILLGDGYQRLYDVTHVERITSPVKRGLSDDPNAPTRTGDSDTSIPIPNEKVNVPFSLPAPSVIAQQANEYQLRQLNDYNGPTPGDGQRPRQFADQTAQDSPAMPDYVKQYLWNSYGEHFYDADTNRAQVERGWQRVSENGMEAERDRLMNLERFSADDTAEANLLMAIAFGTGDVETALGLASRYNQEGTEVGQELQARKLFSKMNPMGAKIWVAGHAERKFKEWQQSHQPAVKRITTEANRVADIIRDMQGGEEHLHLTDGSDLTIDSSNNKWGIPLNEQQLALIDHYHLDNVARPGIHYNWATTRQRMLEAILCTPNPLELTGGGMNLVERLEYMHSGEAVITNADLEYIGNQMATFVGAGGEAGGREANVAISRAYEAFGNITPATGREKFRTWRYTSMLMSLPSAIRNVIGNATQNAVNAASHGLAVAFDHIVAGVTGRRSVSSLTPRERIDGWRAFVDETKNTFADYFIDKTTTNPRPQERFSTHKRGREFQSGLELLRRTESLLMSVGDRNVWRKAYVNAVAELQRVNDMNIQNGQRGMTQEELLDLAESEANYATFNEDSNLANILNQMKQDPHWGFLVDYVVPFTGVTTNVTKRMLQYSPFGLVGTVVKVARDAHMGENFDQRAFVQGLSRGLSSFGMIAVGALLKSLGLIKIGYKDEEDSKAKGLRKAMGEQYTPYLQLGDKNINLSAFNPASAAFVMGAAWHEEAQKIDGSLGDGMLNMLFSAGDMIFDSSYMTSLKDALGGSGYGGEGFTQNFANTLISSMASQPVPALVQQTAKAFDPYVRDTKDSNTLIQTAKELLNKIPFARELLPKSIDAMGKEEFNDAQGAWNYVQPLNIKQQDNEPAAVEILRLEDVLGSSTHVPSDALSGGKTTLKFSGKSYIVAGDDKQFYRERYGTLWLNGGTTYDKDGAVVMVTGVADLIQTEEYKAASDKDKANMIKAIVSQAKTGASYEVVMRISPTE